MKKNTQKGMTLIEITVVLLVLVGLAGLVLPYVGGVSGKALCDATDVSMENIKKAIMDRYYLDTLGAFPVDRANTDYSLKYLFISGDGVGTDWFAFDPDTQVGWRGPYLSMSATLDSEAALATNLTAAAGTHVETAFVDGDSVVFDAWGRPIVIQNSPAGFRLVSAGSGAGLGVANADIETTIAGNRVGDDRVLYLNTPTPAVDINPACS